jgi:hypothetical protein
MDPLGSEKEYIFLLSSPAILHLQPILHQGLQSLVIDLNLSRNDSSNETIGSGVL